MPLIPVSFLLALLCLIGIIALRRSSHRTSHLELLLLIYGAQNVILGLRYGYHLQQVGWLQPIGTILIPGLIYLALRDLMGPAQPLARQLWHVFPLLLVLLCLFWEPWLLDALLIAVYVGYALAMLGALREGEDRLAMVPLNCVWMTRRFWSALALLLLGVALIDLLIAIDFTFWAGQHAPTMVTIANIAVMLAVLGVVFNGQHAPLEMEDVVESEPETGPAAANEEDLTPLFQQIDRLLRQSELYKESNLNLNRLARRAGVPMRKASRAINQCSGSNVSQYVNHIRIERAAEWLLASDRPVTDIMLDVGFQTKSNFNREFLRIYGVAPKQWRLQHRAP